MNQGPEVPAIAYYRSIDLPKLTWHSTAYHFAAHLPGTVIVVNIYVLFVTYFLLFRIAPYYPDIDMLPLDRRLARNGERNNIRVAAHAYRFVGHVAILRVISIVFCFGPIRRHIHGITDFTQSQWLSDDRMACLMRLKQDIKFIEAAFPTKHDRFQILSASVDEIACRFIGKNGEKYLIQASITVSILEKKNWLYKCIST